MRNFSKRMLVGILLAGMGFLVFKIVLKIQFKKDIVQKTSTLKQFSLIDLAGKKAQVSIGDSSTILIFFNTDCHFCQDEAKRIQSSIFSFTGSKLYFISSETVDLIKTFSKEYKLSGHPNIAFGQMVMNDIYQNFGTTTIPSLFIYNKKGMLAKQFKGEVKTDSILKYIDK